MLLKFNKKINIDRIRLMGLPGTLENNEAVGAIIPMLKPQKNLSISRKAWYYWLLRLDLLRFDL